MKASNKKNTAIEEIQSIIDQAFNLYHLVSIGDESHLYDFDYNELIRSLLPLRLTLEGAREEVERMLEKGGVNKAMLAQRIRDTAKEAGRQEMEIAEWLHHWNLKIRKGALDANATAPLNVLQYNLKVVSLLAEKIEAVYDCLIEQQESQKGGIEL